MVLGLLRDASQRALGELEPGLTASGERGPEPLNEVLIGIGRVELDDLEFTGCWTVALPQEVPPAGVSFRSESLSMPEKG